MKGNYRKLGEYTTQRREKNNETSLPICGVCKEGLIPPKQQDADTSLYNVFYKNDFIFNPARMELNSITLNSDYEKAICSSLYEIFYINDTTKLLPEFLYLQLKTDNFVRFCQFQGQGSVREYCRYANISEYPIIVPDLKEQEKIVKTYKTITNRIQLKQKINENLEKTAQCLFEKMFIRVSNCNNLVDTELGLLPKEFNVKPLMNFTPRIESGKRPAGGALAKGYPSLGADCAKGLGGYDESKAKFIPYEYAKKMQKGKIKGYELLAYKDGGKPSEFIPNFAIYGEGYPFDEFAINEHVFLIDFGSKESNIFAYFLFYSKYIYNELSALGSKSAIPGISQTDLSQLYIIDPTCSYAISFGKQVFPFIKSILQNAKEITKLQGLKQFLISRISGI